MRTVSMSGMALEGVASETLLRVAGVLETKAKLGRLAYADERLAELLELFAEAFRGATDRARPIYGVLADLSAVDEEDVVELHGDLEECVEGARAEGDTAGAALFEMVAGTLVSELVRRSTGMAMQ